MKPIDQQLTELVPTVPKFIAFAVAKPFQLLPGAVKRWQSSPFATWDEAKDCLTAYLAGAEHRVENSNIREI